MAPVCLHSSVIRGCVLNQPSGICQHNTVCIRSCWCELRSPMWMEGLPHICWVRWPEDVECDLSHCPLFFFSSFLPLPVSGRKVGLEERKDWKLLNVDYTECCGAYWREKSTSAGSQGSHTVILQRSPPSACLFSGEKASAVSLDVSSTDRHCVRSTLVLTYSSRQNKAVSR